MSKVKYTVLYVERIGPDRERPDSLGLLRGAQAPRRARSREHRVSGGRRRLVRPARRWLPAERGDAVRCLPALRARRATRRAGSTPGASGRSGSDRGILRADSRPRHRRDEHDRADEAHVWARQRADQRRSAVHPALSRQHQPGRGVALGRRRRRRRRASRDVRQGRQRRVGRRARDAPGRLVAVSDDGRLHGRRLRPRRDEHELPGGLHDAAGLLRRRAIRRVRHRIAGARGPARGDQRGLVHDDGRILRHRHAPADESSDLAVDERQRLASARRCRGAPSSGSCSGTIGAAPAGPSTRSTSNSGTARTRAAGSIPWRRDANVTLTARRGRTGDRRCRPWLGCS